MFYIPQGTAGGGTVGGWKELARTTLGGVADAINVASLPNKRYYMILSHLLPSGAIASTYRFNGAATNYAWRRSENGASDSTSASTTEIYAYTSGSYTTDKFAVAYAVNKPYLEKILINQTAEQAGGAGAGTAATRVESVGKWANQTVPISQISSINIGTGDYAANSEVVVLGWDAEDVHTDNFWEELASITLGSDTATVDTNTFTAKKYLWVQIISKPDAGGDPRWKVGNGTVDTGTSYNMRTQYNGASDTTEVNQTLWNNTLGATTDVPTFVNVFFINVATREKFGILNWVQQNTAGSGSSPNRREQVLKWANTSVQMNRMELSLSTGNYRAGTIMKVWGSD